MIHALLQYILLTTGLAASLALFLSLKREMRASAASHRQRLEEISGRLHEADAHPAEPAYFPVPLRPGLNINKRVQAMRMARRKEDVSHIAAVLGVSRKEVELLIRVQKMAAGAAE